MQQSAKMLRLNAIHDAIEQLRVLAAVWRGPRA